MTVLGYTGARVVLSPAVGYSVLENHYADEYVTGGAIGWDALIGAWLYDNRPCKCEGMKSARHDHTVIIPFLKRYVDPWWEGREHVNLVPMHSSSNYRDRNRVIVERSDELHAFPEYSEDHPKSTRSGTWMTVRIARRLNVPVYVHQ